MKVLFSVFCFLAGKSPLNDTENDEAGSVDDDLKALNDSDEGNDGDSEDGDDESEDDGDGDDGDGNRVLGPTEKGEFMKNRTDRVKPTAVVGNFTLTPPVNATIPPFPSTKSTKKRWYASSSFPL